MDRLEIQYRLKIFPYSPRGAPKHIICHDCGGNGWGPMLRNPVWRTFKFPRQPVVCRQYLCQPCIEAALGRELTSDDLRDCPMNHHHVLYKAHGFDD